MNPTVNITLKDVSTGDILRVIDLNFRDDEAQLFNCLPRIKDCSMPYSIPLSELHSMINNKNLVLVEDPFIRYLREEELTEKVILIRDRACNAVIDLVKTEDIYSPVLRLRLVKAICKQHKISKPTAYKILKKYWRNGMNCNALLPEFEKCGAPAKERNCGVSQEVRALIRKGFKEFVIEKGYTIRTAYKETLRKHYQKEKHGKKFKDHTFYLHGRSAFPDEIIKRSKNSEKGFESNERLLKGRSNDLVNGPCKLYQIDSTKRDIRIVSSLNPNQSIGRPTFYVVQDVWSRAIVGVLITLDNPSYIAAAQALFVSFRSKDLLIRELGLGPEHLGWSNSFIPDDLVADRAEFLGPKSDQIVKNLGIRLGNTVAYRPDLKGNVEKIIDIIQERVRHLFLGKGQVLKNDKERTAKDTTREACVTLNQLYQITWIAVNEYNNFHWIEDYPLTSEMVRDGVKKIPSELHKWGIQEKKGVERSRDEKTLWFNLMEAKYVVPNKKGIRLNKQEYVPAEDEGFKILQNLICAPKVKEIKIIYDPRVYGNIYWVYNEIFYKLRLRGKDDVQYSNEWEAVTTNEKYNEIRNQSQDIELDVGIANNTTMEKIISTNDDRKQVARNSRSAATIQREFDRASMEIIKDEQSVTKSQEKSLVTSKKRNKLLAKLARVND